MKKQYLFPVGLNMMLMFFSASCVIYYPHQKNIPLMEKKNELQADLGVGFVKPNVHTSIAWSPAENFEIAASGEIDSDYLKFFQTEAGYYDKINGRFNYELLAGFGFGKGEAFESDGDGKLNGRLFMPYLQYNFGQRHLGRGNFDYGFGLKGGWLYTDLQDNDYYDNTEVEIADLYDHSLVIEPKAFIRFGWENVKVNFQAGYCYLYKFTNRNYSIPYSPVGLSFGITYIYQSKEDLRIE